MKPKECWGDKFSVLRDQLKWDIAFKWDIASFYFFLWKPHANLSNLKKKKIGINNDVLCV